MTIWTIMSKVRIESFCWGVGTALGELPPYFMARAHRLSGDEPDDDEEDELLELQQKDPDSLVRHLKLIFLPLILNSVKEYKMVA